MYNATEYDLVLLGLAVAIFAMGAGIVISPYVSIAAGLLGVAIAGYAMFGIPPIDGR